MKTSLVAAVAAASLLAAAAPAAQASVTAGQVLSNPDTAGTCGPNGGLGLQALQLPSAAGGTAGLASGGVVTQWSSAGRTSAASPDVHLLIMRPADLGFYRIVGLSDAATVPQGATGTFPTRITVEAGDVLGLHVPTGSAPCYGSSPAGKVGFAQFGENVFPSDLGIGVSYGIGGFSTSPARVNVAVTIEADADGDGYGDETQDLCPADAAVHDACPAPAGTDPGTTPDPGTGTDPGAGTPLPGTVPGPPVTTPIAPPPPAPPVKVAPKPLKVPSFKASKGGKATAAFSESTAGKLTWKARSGKTVVVSGSKSLAKGKHSVSISLNAAGRKLVKKKGTLKVTVTFTFTPKGGKPSTGTRSVTFKR